MKNDRPVAAASGSGTGTTREQRAQPALDPAHVLVDERSFPELLVFATRYARLLTYYDVSGTGSGDWSVFFDYDISFLLAEMCTVDIEGESAGILYYERKFSGGEDDADSYAGDRKTLEKQALKVLYGTARRVNGWYVRAVNISGRNEEGASLRVTLESMIRQELRRHYLLLRQSRQWNGWLAEWLAEDDYTFAPIWTETVDIRHEKKAPAQGYDRLINALHSFNKVNRKLATEAGNRLAESLEKPNHPPHTALYIAFLKLLEVVRKDLNGFTGRHLDFYYRTVLRLQEREGVPDIAHLYCQLAKHATDYELKAGSLLRAGKDATGQDLLYAIDRDVDLNRARIGALKTLFVASGPNEGSQCHPRRVIRILAAQVADSADGSGQPLRQPELGWPTFGRDVVRYSAEDSDALHAHLGLLIASPVLLLAEGERQVALTFRFANPEVLDRALDEFRDAGSRVGYLEADESVPDSFGSDPALRSLLADAFLVWFSGPEGWVGVKRFSFRRRRKDAGGPAGCVDLRFALAPGDSPLVECRPDVHAYGLDFPQPCLRLELNPHARIYAYSFFKDLALAEVSLRVEVRGLKKAELRGATGPVKTDQPFQLFGALPMVGSFLEIGSRELGQKPLDRVSLSIEWLNLPMPPENFRTHYEGYGKGIDNGSFRARMLAQSDGGWKDVCGELKGASGKGPFPLFTQAGPADETLFPVTALSFDFGTAPLPAFSNAWSGSGKIPARLRLELAEPSFAFGHDLYPRLLAEAAMAQSSRAAGSVPPPIPNPPFAPVAKSISLDYAAQDRLVLDDSASAVPTESQRLRIFYVSPFGYSGDRGGVRTLFRSYDAEGSLRIGLTGLDPPQTLTLLFHLEDDPAAETAASYVDEQGLESSRVRWSYLAGNRWEAFDPSALVSDTTAGLMRSGIVKLAIPRQISADHTDMPDGLFWIQASVPQRTEEWPNTVGIFTQAATATRFCPPGQAASSGVLPAGTIKEFASKAPAIAAVCQPFPTSGGRPAESPEDFRVRVAERLRHKQRAVQPSEYEHLVLDAFPEIGQVKCVSWNSSQDYPVPPVPPGEIIIVVVPAAKPGAALAEPRVPRHTLIGIRDYLARYVSPFVRRIRVRNPAYERVKLFASVRLASGLETGPALRRLNDAIGDFLAPWRADPLVPMEIGGGIGQGHKVQMLIECRSEIEQVVALGILHTYRDGDQYHVDYWPPEESRRGPDRRSGDEPIRGSAAWSVLVPASQHDLVAVDDAAGGDSPRIGLSLLEVGVDWIVDGGN